MWRTSRVNPEQLRVSGVFFLCLLLFSAWPWFCSVVYVDTFIIDMMHNAKLCGLPYDITYNPSKDNMYLQNKVHVMFRVVLYVRKKMLENSSK